MWLNENLIKFIESSAEISKATIYISDIRKIKISAVPSKKAEKIDKLVSREILETLLVIGTGIEQDRYVIINSKNNVIPLLEDENEKINFISQIILPLWADNELKGALILVSENRKLDDYDLELARSIQIFIEESIINSINEEYLKNTEKKKIKSVLKKEKTENTNNDENIITLNNSIDENDM